MTIQYQLSEPEVLRAFLKSRRVSIWRVFLRLGVVMAGVAFVLWSRYKPSYHSQSDFTVGYMFVFFGLILVIFTPLLSRAAYAKYVHANAAIFTAPYSVTPSETGLAFASPEIKSEFAWTVYKKLSEDDQYFYLYGQNKQPLAVMPKRAFDTTGLEEFRRLSQSIPRA